MRVEKGKFLHFECPLTLLKLLLRMQFQDRFLYLTSRPQIKSSMNGNSTRAKNSEIKTRSEGLKPRNS